MSQFTKPVSCTLSLHSSSCSNFPPVVFVHFSLSFSVTLFVNWKSISSCSCLPSLSRIGILPVNNDWQHIHSSLRVIISSSSVKSRCIFSTALWFGDFPLYKLSPGVRFKISSMIVILLGAINGGSYVFVWKPSFSIVTPPIFLCTNGANCLLPFLKSTSIFCVSKVSTFLKNVSLINVCTFGIRSTNLPIVLGS